MAVNNFLLAYIAYHNYIYDQIRKFFYDPGYYLKPIIIDLSITVIIMSISIYMYCNIIYCKDFIWLS